jgi:MFS family permease
MTPDVAVGSWIDSDVPVRLDMLRWSAWHRRVVLALGITWVLDGLEASLVANLAPTLQDPRALGLTATQIGWTNTCYLVGQVLGALGFAHLTDRFGRKRLFLITLGLYLCATAACSSCCGFSPAPASAANTRRSTPRSTSSSRRACAGGSISGSTAATGPASRPARS